MTIKRSEKKILERGPEAAAEYVMQKVRKGTRSRLTETLPQWRPIWITADALGWSIKRADAVLRIGVLDVPASFVPVLRELFEVLDEQAYFARMMAPIAKIELKLAQAREAGNAASSSERARWAHRGADESKIVLIRREAARLVADGRDPFRNVKGIASKVGCTETHVRKTLKAGGAEA